MVVVAGVSRPVCLSALFGVLGENPAFLSVFSALRGCKNAIAGI